MTIEPSSDLGAPIAADGTDDAELIELGRQLEMAWADELRRMACHISDADSDACINASGAIVERIERSTAHTIAGAIVKAKAISWCCSGKEIDDAVFNEQMTTDVRLAAGLVRDILALRV